MSTTHRVSYSKCGADLAEKGSMRVAESQPCRNCGAFARVHHVGLFALVSFNSMLGGEGKERKKKKPFIEFKIGDSFWNIGQKWMNLIQIVDRRSKKYFKHVEDSKTGDVVRHVDEPLAEHKDRGSAKPKNGARPASMSPRLCPNVLSAPSNRLISCSSWTQSEPRLPTP